MTARIYYGDSQARTFDAMVRACERAEGRIEVLLDRTAFYPSSGGQPFDRGRLGEADVIGVVEREDGEIVHVVTRELQSGSRVTGDIDWGRRLDHMQQHTGQHVLSAAIERTCGAATVSFHMGSDASTIDLAREVSPGEIEAAETEANRIVWEDRVVSVRTVEPEEAARLPLRKESARAGPLRIVEVEGFDLSACGGTHVPRTGVIGIIAVLDWERFKGGMRLSFVCGGRGLSSHRRLRDVVSGASRILSVGAGEIGRQIERMQEEARESDRTSRRIRDELLRYRAEEIRGSAETIGPYRVVLRFEPSADPAALKGMAAVLTGAPGLVVILLGGGEQCSIVAARSAGVDFDAGAFMKSATATLGGRGGGRPELAQGGLPSDAEAIFAFVRRTLAG